MKVVSFNDIQEMRISPETCYEWASDMILHKNEATLPEKVSITMPGNGFCNFMPSIVGKWGGIKVITRYPGRTPSLDSKILLFSVETGLFEALMDGNWITAMRTGAVAAHSILLLGKKDFLTVGMIGLGNVARATLMTLATILKNREFNIKLLRYKNQSEAFAERFQGFENLHFSTVDSVENLIRGSDVVISCATYFEKDIAPDKCFDEGVLVVPVHTRGFTNCDLFFDKIYADDTAHVCHFKNFSKFRFYAEVTDIVNGRKPGRENSGERILAYNIGISLHDINFAGRIFEVIKNDPSRLASLQNAEMMDPGEKFWV